MKKEEVLALLLERSGSFVSGAEVAESLSVSRSAVWKWVEQLRAEGYPIESVTNRGYRLDGDNDLLSAPGIRRHLRHGEADIRVFDSVDSTNAVAKRLASEGAAHGTAVVAGSQTAGRGRLGRSFFSPAGSGLYLSVILRPALPPTEATAITCCAAVATAKAVEAVTGRAAEIKWVNDVLLDGKKVSGILTEAAMSLETGLVDYVVAGIGVNTRPPEGGFPAELRNIAGALGAERLPELHCRLAAAIIDGLLDGCADLKSEALFAEYRRRSAVLGQEILVLAPGREPREALALDLGRDYSLLVRYPDGSSAALSSGEVSVRRASFSILPPLGEGGCAAGADG